MMSSTFECLYGTFVKMVHEGTYDSLIATPVSAEDAVSGDILWGSFRGLISGTLMITVAIIMGILPVSVASILVLLVLMIFVGILFSSLAMIVTSFAPNFDFFNYYSELVITPMLFFSGVFFPLDKFPGWMKTFSHFMPLTHAVAICRGVFSGVYSRQLLFHFLVIFILEVIAFYLGIKLMKKRLIK
jgi:lipooligosaccharide transport system permease protein